MQLWIQNIIKHVQHDRTKLRLIYRLQKVGNEPYVMNARELCYSLEKLTINDNFVLEGIVNIGNKINDFEIIHVILRRLYRQKKVSVMLHGLSDAIKVISSPSILNLYVTYLYRLGVCFLEPFQ